MTMLRRKFTDEQKKDILREAGEFGITIAIRKHNLSYSAFSRWRQQFADGDQTEQQLRLSQQERSELRQYRIENIQLKKIIADQVLELEKKQEELRRNNFSH